MTDALSMWTVYDHPRDYPKGFIARRFEVDGRGARPTRDVMVSDDLDALRLMLMKRGLTALARNEEDDPKIVETWL